MLDKRLFKVASKFARACPSVLFSSTSLISASSSFILVSVEVFTAEAEAITGETVVVKVPMNKRYD